MINIFLPIVVTHQSFLFRSRGPSCLMIQHFVESQSVFRSQKEVDKILSGDFNFSLNLIKLNAYFYCFVATSLVDVFAEDVSISLGCDCWCLVGELHLWGDSSECLVTVAGVLTFLTWVAQTQSCCLNFEQLPKKICVTMTERTPPPLFFFLLAWSRVGCRWSI